MMRWFWVALALCIFTAGQASAADVRPLNIGKATDVWFSEGHTVPMVAIVLSFPRGLGL